MVSYMYLQFREFDKLGICNCLYLYSKLYSSHCGTDRGDIQ